MSSSEDRIDVATILAGIPEEDFDPGEDRWGGANLIYCRSGCPTPGAHGSWGECARAANLQVGPAERDRRITWDRDLAEYRKVRKQGIQPKSVRRAAVEAAKVVNDA